MLYINFFAEIVLLATSKQCKIRHLLDQALKSEGCRFESHPSDICGTLTMRNILNLVRLYFQHKIRNPKKRL